ncbi:MAG TPA: copper homeostasis protein CutC [Streptomyces sp.]|jgi:copper homeostasis protein|nr:copper homeostasis protein CutC [Streptomyces sp.]
MSRPIFEVIALTENDARAARAGGADRLELVTDMDADGLTPSVETFARVRAAVDLPLRVMLRATGGFTSGGAEVLDGLCARAEQLRAEGADEFVLGFLDDDGAPDVRAIDAVNEVIHGCRWTFHRAIDRAADRDGLRKVLAELPGTSGRGGLDTFLTAGSAHGVDAGMETLRAEAARAAAGEPGYGPRNMAGGGLRLEHVAELAAAGVSAFHIGGAARPGGWAGPVDAGTVKEWREVLDACCELQR